MHDFTPIPALIGGALIVIDVTQVERGSTQRFVTLQQ